MKRAIVLALTCALMLPACATSGLSVESQPTEAFRASTATLQYLPPAVTVEDTTQAYLREKMAEKLVGGSDAVFGQGSDITIRFQFTGHNEGSRVGRWLTAGIAGGSKTYIVAEFVNPAGAVVGKVRAEGSVGGGFAGGSAKSGIDGAVNQIAKYARETFKR